MELIIVAIISLLTFLTRVINLLKIPIFTDEAIYIRWAQIGLNDPAHRYIALTDGKQPLLTWLMYPFLKIFPDPLFAGRLVSVIAGVFAVIGIYLLARKLFNKTAAMFTSLIYIFSPFTLVYDRLALMDSLLAMFCIWSIYLEILLIEKPKLDRALLLGITIGGGYLTKSSALFFILLLPAGLLLFNFKKYKIKNLIKWGSAAVLSVFIAQVIYNSLRLSPWFYLIKQKNYTFIYTFSEFYKSPFQFFLPNLHGLLDILTGYLTYPVSTTLILAIIYGIIKKDKRILYLFLWFIFPFLSLAAFGKIIFPRFILFMTVPLFVVLGSILADVFVFSIKKMRIFLVVFPLMFIIPVYQCLLLIFSPVNANIPVIDRNQLFDDWPSGYGVPEVINYLNNESKKGKIVVGTEGTFGLFPAALEIYLGRNENINIRGYWPVGKVPDDLLEAANDYPTYLIFKEKQQIPADWPIRLIAKYPRGKSVTSLLFYKVLSSQNFVY